ncbi:membrane protein [Mycoplana sp. BE70]|uniref:YihY/virulence factor BrkB family protein n=1 Tax=Mycoplana sp. BE70 TaxID=2817775 RepID=UPI0028649B5F|nr:YihY/virulence factor BrkB family protein [Mycoplana sp. BE70]MDR6757008.1 membrane protein [Mycoplana sp. BE70]
MSQHRNGARKALVLAALALAAGALLPKKSGKGERRVYRSATGSTQGETQGDGHGRRARAPKEIPPPGLRDVFWRLVGEVADDRVTLIAAGVTFYLLLALFPALAALVSLYGLLADPVAIQDHIREMASVLPQGAFEVFSNQLQSLVERRDTTLGIAFFVGLGVALWSTHNGTLAVFDAMNVAYDEDEKRGLLRLNLIALVFTIGAMLAAVIVIGAIALMPAIVSRLSSSLQETLALVVRWPFLLAMMFAASTAVYRFGPSRQPARFRWITWGAALSTVAWFLMTLAFSWYVSNFANYNATYGTLGGLVGFLVWTWLSVAILIVGAELNAELEHQTARDSTTGAPLPMGARGASMADHLGKTAD